jgi:hypothetical protein
LKTPWHLTSPKVNYSPERLAFDYGRPAQILYGQGFTGADAWRGSGLRARSLAHRSVERFVLSIKPKGQYGRDNAVT